MWILLVSLLILLFLEYIIFNKYVLSPSLIITMMFFLSTFMLLFYAKRWGMVWNDKTTAVILVGILASIIGELFAKKSARRCKGLFDAGISYKRKMFLGKEDFRENVITLSLGSLIGLNLICVVTLIVYYKETIRIASFYAGYETLLLMQVNKIKTSGYAVSSLAQQLLTISNSIALLFAYIVVMNLKKKEKIKYKLLYFSPMVLYLITALFTSGRAVLLHFLIAAFVIWFLVYDRERSFVRRGNIKLFSRVIILVVAIIVIFYYAGMLTGKSLHYDALSDNMANYFCSSIYALNAYLGDPAIFDSSSFFGIHTFSGLYTTLRTIGIDIPRSVVALEYIPCGYVVTNIYTALRRYFQDFGWVGLFFIMFAVSWFYSRIIALNRTEHFSGVRTILTGMIFYPLVFMSIEERFFMNVISISTIYCLVYISILYAVFVYPQTKIVSVKGR
ncbi:O-antigen polymerase [Oribacterium sp. P6A1]|uniref:O-antigen polymerase n=1 Tax=Oribacterium sp. P6A1 TaxID=1410612 RepID=UPI00056C2ED6|nr:O-antigen polymerase [Oribacterium sp. P6A1]